MQISSYIFRIEFSSLGCTEKVLRSEKLYRKLHLYFTRVRWNWYLWYEGRSIGVMFKISSNLIWKHSSTTIRHLTVKFWASCIWVVWQPLRANKRVEFGENGNKWITCAQQAIILRTKASLKLKMSLHHQFTQYKSVLLNFFVVAQVWPTPNILENQYRPPQSKQLKNSSIRCWTMGDLK